VSALSVTVADPMRPDVHGHVPNGPVRDAVEAAIRRGALADISELARWIGWPEANLRRALGYKAASRRGETPKPQTRMSEHRAVQVLLAVDVYPVEVGL
jgi:hypothetical protein